MPNLFHRRGLRILLSALGPLALSACASLPPAPIARVAKATGAYATAKAFEGPAAAWPGDDWWKAYGDHQLDALMGEALASSPDLAQARARVLKAQAVSAQARSALLPQISGNANLQEAKQSYQYLIPQAFLPLGYQDYAQATLNLNWELDFWGKNRAAMAAAASRAQAGAADAAEARLILTTDIATSYATLAQLYADLDVADEAVKVRRETAGLVAQRVTNGLDTQAELKQAQAATPAALANRAAINEQIALTRDELAALLGDGPDRGLTIDRPAKPRLAQFGLPADLRINLIGRRPDVVAARWRAQAAVKDVTGAKAQFYPDIDISGFIGQQALHLNQILVPGAQFGAIGPAISLPIFDGGRLRANLRGAQADREAAIGAYDQAVTEAFHEVADAAASERALDERLGQSRLALESYEQAYHVARLRYEGGLSTFQAVLLAEDAVLTQRRVVSDLESRGFVLDIALVRALGGGFRET